MLPSQKKSFMIWYLCSGRKCGGKEKIHPQTSENLYFARNFPKSFLVLLRKQEGDTWDYIFSVAGVDITSMLIQMLDLEAAEVVIGSATWLGKGLLCVCGQIGDSDSRFSLDLTPAEKVCLQRLHNRIDVPYDTSLLERQEALRALWDAAFPEEELHDLVSEQWKKMGWQEKDPSTDLSGGGYVSSENLLYSAMSFPVLNLRITYCLIRIKDHKDSISSVVPRY